MQVLLHPGCQAASWEWNIAETFITQVFYCAILEFPNWNTPLWTGDLLKSELGFSYLPLLWSYKFNFIFFSVVKDSALNGRHYYFQDCACRLNESLNRSHTKSAFSYGHLSVLKLCNVLKPWSQKWISMQVCMLAMSEGARLSFCESYYWLPINLVQKRNKRTLLILLTKTSDHCSRILKCKVNVIQYCEFFLCLHCLCFCS